MSTDFFSDLLSTISERGRNLLRLRPAAADAKENAADLIQLCDELLSGRGEASGTVFATAVLNRYQELDKPGRTSFFHLMASKYGADAARVEKAITDWHNSLGEDTGDLHFASEPRRQELFRRLNRAPGGTHAIVEMRADLLDVMNGQTDLSYVDRDMAHLLASWFNRGFLVLKRIDWSTPANILEKVIRYEAVHEIHDWEDLRRRIDPEDRRCYGFFHPALLDEPLIFVEIALTEAIPGSIAPLLAVDREPVPVAKARTAVFYSISNCQRGLAGISFGNFLIKQVVEELRRELPKLDTFVTLSPVPGFRKWLKTSHDLPVSEEGRALLELLDTPDWSANEALAGQLRSILEPLAAHYFLRAKLPRGAPMDSVARFHLGNGARLERINWLGDTSVKGMRESAGIMVNYLYQLDDIERNHEAYAQDYEVKTSSAVKKMLKTDGKRLVEPR